MKTTEMKRLEADATMRLSIVHVLMALLRTVEAIAEDCQHDTTTVLLRHANAQAFDDLASALLAHPANQPAEVAS